MIAESALGVTVKSRFFYIFSNQFFSLFWDSIGCIQSKQNIEKEIFFEVKRMGTCLDRWELQRSTPRRHTVHQPFYRIQRF